MNKRNCYAGIDHFRIIAALLIVAIHTSPLSSINKTLDFIIVRIFARIAVPFFLMTTGYFLLPRYMAKKNGDWSAVHRFIKKTCTLYGIAILLYLPVNFYAGHFTGKNFFSIVIKDLLFDGTFYHLWYLPASIIGILIICLLCRKYSLKTVLIISSILYIIALFGDSYYGIVSQISWIQSIYDFLFTFSSYTRNGIFYAPIFLFMGYIIAKSGCCQKKFATISFLITIFLMTIEGLVLHNMGLQRHDSMYIFLLPCMFFLFQILLNQNGRSLPVLRTISACIYIIHPLFIIVVRGIAKVTGLSFLLIHNSVIHYIVVCIFSIIFSIMGAFIMTLNKKSNFYKGRAWMELDLNALRHNVEALKKLLPTGCELMPAVKADAYGHGSIKISQELNKLGIKAFCVASVTEGVTLRQNNVKGEILILGYTHPSQFYLLKEYELSQTVVDYKYAKLLNEYGKIIKVHIKIDTGMHRLGERPENISHITKMFECDNLSIQGIFSHLCVSDSLDKSDVDFTYHQIQCFYETIEQLEALGYSCPKKHIQSSYGLLNYPELSCDYARVGIILYGVLSTAEDRTKSAIDLQPILSIKARVSIVKELLQGEAVGYGLEFTAPKDMKIAIVSIGYGDGIPRSLSNGNGNVLINGEMAPIIGRMCMDQTIINVSNIPSVKQNDIAVILGKSGDAEITAYDIASHANTITNEILSRLGNRLCKVYCYK
ncbi:serine racemase VanT catalytic subunit [Clostridium lundense]|uniref:serine racemase VanT catalytic subunit n=1 Tax=Clostridium lundense TaxID=319475 RepID=UPI0004815577|nr:serine racemase VanT catalytic subunit [Clostridium lundense]